MQTVQRSRPTILQRYCAARAHDGPGRRCRRHGFRYAAGLIREPLSTSLADSRGASYPAARETLRRLAADRLVRWREAAGQDLFALRSRQHARLAVRLPPPSARQGGRHPPILSTEGAVAALLAVLGGQ